MGYLTDNWQTARWRAARRRFFLLIDIPLTIVLPAALW